MSENQNQIQCDKTIYRKFLKSIENTHFWIRDFFVFSIEGEFK